MSLKGPGLWGYCTYLYVFRWYFLSLIMWGARERMAFRKIFPALRIFSEGTWILIQWKERKKKKEKLYKEKKKKTPDEYLNHFLTLASPNTAHSHIYIVHLSDMSLFYLRTETHWIFTVSRKCIQGFLIWCSDILTTSSGYLRSNHFLSWRLINPPTSHYLANGVSRTKRNVRFNERCLKNKMLRQKKIKQKVR